MLLHRSVLLWAIILYAVCNAIWTGFAASGIWLLEPSARMGDIRPVRTALVSAQNWAAFLLWSALAIFAFRRSRAALWITLALIVVKLLGWWQAAAAAQALPDLPIGMIVIWVMYRVSMITLLALIAAYIGRLDRKDRLT